MVAMRSGCVIVRQGCVIGDVDWRDESHAFLLKTATLLIGTAECESGCKRTVAEHDAMAGYALRVRIGMQCEADEARVPRVSGQCGDLTVGGDLAAGNAAHHGIHSLAERCR